MLDDLKPTNNVMLSEAEASHDKDASASLSMTVAGSA